MLGNYLSYETIEEKLFFIQSLDEDKKDELLMQLREKQPREYRKISGKINAIEQEISLFEKASITSIPLNQIEVNPYQPRKYFSQEKIDILANSIKENGLISPILLSKTNNNRYILIAGERRYRALKQLCEIEGEKFCEIEAKVLNNVDNKKLQTLAILENIQRENLTLREEAKSLLDLNNTDMPILEIAKLTGMSKSKVGRYIKIAKLHNLVLNEMEKLEITSSTLMEFITTLDDVDTQIKAIKQAKEGKTIQQLKSLYNKEEAKQEEEPTTTTEKIKEEEQIENLDEEDYLKEEEEEEEEEPKNLNENSDETPLNTQIPKKIKYKYKDKTLILENIEENLKNKILELCKM